MSGRKVNSSFLDNNSGFACVFACLRVPIARLS